MKTTKEKIATWQQKYPNFAKAYEFASLQHANDFRKDGKPYMFHVDEVIVGTMLEVDRVVNIPTLRKYKTSLIEIFLIAASCHDVFEDHRELKASDFYNIFDFGSFEHGGVTWEAIQAITKEPKGEEEYSEYVYRVQKNLIARIVKIADLKHNMSDLKPGNMLDKYNLTLFILEQKISLEPLEFIDDHLKSDLAEITLFVLNNVHQIWLITR